MPSSPDVFHHQDVIVKTFPDTFKLFPVVQRKEKATDISECVRIQTGHQGSQTSVLVAQSINRVAEATPTPTASPELELVPVI